MTTLPALHELPLAQHLHFHHPEVALLFQRSMRIAPEEVQSLLALPHDTLAADLRAILRHAVEHFDRYDDDAVTWSWETMSAPLHAIMLLSELPGRENLEAILEFLAAEEDVLDIHLGDLLTDMMWEPIAKLAEGNYDLATTFLRDPVPEVYARIMVGHGITHSAYTWPEKLPDVGTWLSAQLRHFSEVALADPAFDQGIVDSLIFDAVHLGLKDQLPVIELLYSSGRASNFYYGTIDEVRKGFNQPGSVTKAVVLPLTKRYERLLSFQEMTERDMAKEKEREAQRAAALEQSSVEAPVASLPIDDLDFNHPEVAILFQRSMRIAPEEVHALLALPHDTLAADLRAILRQAVERFDQYQAAEEEDWQWDAMSAPMHAILLLSELPGRENLDAILGFLASDDEPIRFHLGDHLTEFMWEPVAKLAVGHFDRLAQFVRTPCPDTFSRVAAAEGMNRVVWTWPDQAPAVAQWYKEQLIHFSQLPDGDPAIDETLIAALVSDCMDQEWADLLPEIEPLFLQYRVDTGYCGDWEYVQQQMTAPRYRAQRETVMPLAARYADMLQVEEDIRQRMAKEKHIPPHTPEHGMLDRTQSERQTRPVAPQVRNQPKVGRNDPCPCGSGKKYKKCCGG